MNERMDGSSVMLAPSVQQFVDERVLFPHFINSILPKV